MLRRCAIVLGAAAVVAVVHPWLGAAAQADGDPGSGGIWGNVDCAQNPYPGCQLSAGSSTHTSGPTSPTGQSSGGVSGGSGPAEFSCLNLMPYVPTSGPLPPPEGQTASSGGWYVSVCSGFHLGMPGGGVFYPPIWIAGRPNQPLPPSPQEVALRAENDLALPAAAIVLSPAGQQLVNLPTWLAVSSASWGARSATVSVPGVSVTATARPVSVVWSTGDGARLTCRGPGTVYRADDDPSAASPTCGHTYLASSATAPGGVYVVSATVSWSVSWAGAGQAGTFPGLTTTATVRVPVAESQALITR